VFGIKYVRFEPNDYVLKYRKGNIVSEGAGLSFFYFAPTTSLVRIPTGSVDLPFIFQEVTADFQEVTVQGQITYVVAEPKKLASLMNFTLDSSGTRYASGDPEKLSQRIVNHTQVLTRATLKQMDIRSALGTSDLLSTSLKAGLQEADVVTELGVNVIGLSILAIRPTPDTARALEAEAREQILKEADSAIYARRNASVEQERGVKENELNTEIAIEVKKREIRETQMDAEMSVQQKTRELKEAEIAAEVAIEVKRKELVELATANARQEADAKAYAIAAMMNAFATVDPKVISALSSAGMDPSQLIAQAFRELAVGAERIGELNISPDLMRELMRKAGGRSPNDQ
jgi:hypothetical protein